MRDILVLQICLSAAMLLATFMSGSTPLLILNLLQKRGGEDQMEKSWFSYLNCFSGGIFLATSFLDLIPENGENYEEWLKEYKMSPPIPCNYLFLCIGFFVVFMMEEVTAFFFGDGHGHSHGISKKEKGNKIDKLVIEEAPSTPKKSNLVKMLTFVVAISFHSFLEGFALGVQETKSSMYSLFLSLLLHKVIEAFSVGLQMSKTLTGKNWKVVIIILLYSSMTPIGSVMGTVLKASTSKNVWKDGLIVMLESMAGGTFIYITFVEIVSQEKVKAFSSINQLLSMITGFVLILCVQLIFH